MMKPVAAALVGGVLVLAGGGAARATVFGGNASFTDTSVGNNGVNFTATAITNPFATSDLTAGNSFTWASFATIQGTDNNNSFFTKTYSDSIALALNFSQPTTAAASQGGTGSMTTYSFFGTIFGYSGDVTWGGTQQYDSSAHRYYSQSTVNFSDGAVAQLDIYNTTLNGTGSTRSGNVMVRLVDMTDPVSAPEPASLAMLATGLLGLAMVARQRRRPL